MKKKLSSIFFGLVFVAGLGIFIYPTASEQWNKLHQSKAIERYEEAMAELGEEDYEAIWEAARRYNDGIITNTFPQDAFSQEVENMKDTEYWSILNPGDNGIMGYISIPKIDQKLPIYHGTSESVLQIAVGHMTGTKLPIGDEGGHSVLAGHRGLPSAKLFSDIDRLENGDCFYIHVLGEVLAYEVDEIYPMIDKNDIDTLTEVMQNVEGQDYVTLFTCTPYGVNSHRLLVRGKRTEYQGEEEEKVVPAEAMLESVKDYYVLYSLVAAGVAILVAILIAIWKRRKSVKKVREEKDEKD